ncbi:protein Wnt-11-like [Clytia hemisphaerica]|uniref:Protein Wnt n=1 Tax=Clytia hemisphaerica TaxID=252671 RepID=A0A7M5WKB8_9CNID
MKITLFILIIGSLCACVQSNIKWVGIKNYPINAIWTKHDVCTKRNGFTWRQVRFCRQQFPWMLFAHDAAKDTVDECETVLKQHQWNCQTINKAPAFNIDLKKDTKESAFVHALSASTLALTVARGCMAGKLDKCTCLQRKQQISFPSEMVGRDNASSVNNLVGCKGILSVGKRFSSEFMSAGVRWKAKTDRHKMEMAVQKHNLNVGLQELNGGEHISCTCNGATAGCTVKFCHRRLVLMQDVANKLLNKYHNAVQTSRNDFHDDNKSNTNKGTSLDIYKAETKHEKSLIYLDNVDHCKTNKGVYSSTGRRCTAQKSSPDSCDKICCGKGHRIRRIEIHSKCNCKFVYCCDVKCETCVRYDTILECL